MKLVRPNTVSPLPTSLRKRANPRSQRPQWLVQWIRDQSRFVLLECGHKVNLANDRALLIIQSFKGSQIACEKCEEFVGIERSMTLFEYFEIPPPVNSQIPLF